VSFSVELQGRLDSSLTRMGMSWSDDLTIKEKDEKMVFAKRCMTLGALIALRQAKSDISHHILAMTSRDEYNK